MGACCGKKEAEEDKQNQLDTENPETTDVAESGKLRSKKKNLLGEEEEGENQEKMVYMKESDASCTQ